ncbi:hypothetical protein C7974DRAFT_164602 [Boeremia exigua]|uniref:uncharacterized protein n=1 Tax=Boeremia exigua TaxID=749465 RepID=UPI001E8CECB6|nr:uncharacterized protein C7974DRAFT_164602 [Boeremia exigua]KAH6633097.1 hypothetical protein C7974DRAFT_164602 [Boeremia exigua]
MSDTLSGTRLPSDTPAAGTLEELKAASLRFLVDIKARLGDSSQLDVVHKTLDSFRKGAMSKRDAYTTIHNTLEGHDDLRQGLLDIIMHPAAEWAPGDFDLPTMQPTQPLIKPTPEFLQPPHQSQVRLPSISSKWHQPLGQMTYCGYNDYKPTESSPELPGLALLQLPHQPTHNWVDDRAKTDHPAVHDDTPVLPPVHPVFRNPWHDASYADTWANGDMYVGDQFYAQESLNISYSGHLQPPVIYSQDIESYQQPSFLSQTALSPTLTPQSTYEPTPASNEDSVFYRTSLYEKSPVRFQVLPTPISQSPPDMQQSRDTTEYSQTDRPHSPKELFIHALCGKGFTTLAAVKKHHWGKKTNDLATTTGCWAKHKKPNTPWYAHSSCEYGQHASEKSKSFSSTSKQGQLKASSQRKTQTPSTSLQFNTVPGFPTLSDLPNAVARTLSAGNPSPGELSSRYHTHRLPSSSGFDSLLTAVNMVSQIDAPKPETRTNSIALHLDAQVAASEQEAQFVPYVPAKSSRGIPIAVPDALKSVGIVLGEPANGGSGHLPNHGKEECLLRSQTGVAGSVASAAFSQPLEPLHSGSSGPAKKKRRV